MFTLEGSVTHVLSLKREKPVENDLNLQLFLARESVQKGNCKALVSYWALPKTTELSKKAKAWEVEETSWFFPFRTGGRRKAMISLSISYKMELKALGSWSKD